MANNRTAGYDEQAEWQEHAEVLVLHSLLLCCKIRAKTDVFEVGRDCYGIGINNGPKK